VRRLAPGPIRGCCFQRFGGPITPVHDIRVEITADKDRLTAQVEDDGVYFDPLRRAGPDITLPIEKRSVGGLRLFFVRKVMDELSYSREAGRNRLTMAKRVTRI
jgi:serine/threonine-protein kinase RsbW